MVVGGEGRRGEQTEGVASSAPYIRSMMRAGSSSKGEADLRERRVRWWTESD